jgi:hypothetical protein
MDAHGTRPGTGSMTQVSAGSASDRYKWVVLSNTTLGSFMAVLDTTIMLIALPDIFRGIHINPLAPGNSFYLLWMILSFMVVTSVLVVSLGRLGDMYGRVRMYNLGFAVYTFFSLVLAVTWMSGTAGALWLVVMRVFQGVGAALLIANSAAILTDAFPEDERGMALGINQVAGLSGSFIGLILGGVLAPIEWRLIFLVSVPAGLFGTIWAYAKLREVPRRETASLDWPGNIAFAVGLVGILVGITYGIQPYGRQPVLPARRRGPRWPHVHADHLAPGDLAATPRLQLQPDSLVGRHLHAAVDRGLPPGRAGVGLPLRPLRVPAVRVGGGWSWRPARSSSWSCCPSTSPTACSARYCSSTAWPWAPSPRPTVPG